MSEQQAPIVSTDQLIEHVKERLKDYRSLQGVIDGMSRALGSKLSDVDVQLASINDRLKELHPDLFKQIDDLTTKKENLLGQFDVDTTEYKQAMNNIGAEIEAETIRVGATIQIGGPGTDQCVFTSAKVTWNDDFLLGLAENVPAILAGRKVGKPSASIRLGKVNDLIMQEEVITSQVKKGTE